MPSKEEREAKAQLDAQDVDIARLPGGKPDPEANKKAMDELQKLWDELKAYDRRMYRRARHGVVGLATNLPGTVGRALTLAGYRAAQKLVKFN